MKNVLIISASPRKNGNSDILCDRFAQGAEENGHKTEKVFIASKNKDFYFIMTAADTEKTNLNRMMEAFRGFTEDCLDGAKKAGIIYGTGAWQIGEIKDTPTYDEAYEMGRNIYEEVL